MGNNSIFIFLTNELFPFTVSKNVNQCGNIWHNAAASTKCRNLIIFGLNLGDIKQAYQLGQVYVEDPELGGGGQQRL